MEEEEEKNDDQAATASPNATKVPQVIAVGTLVIAGVMYAVIKSTNKK